MWKRIAALALLAVLLPTLMPQQQVAFAGSWVTDSVSTLSGTRNYKLWVPTNYTDSSAVPLVMMLHGCTQDPDDFAAGTQMNAVADEHTFLAVYPQQPSNANMNKCWNWFETMHQSRGSGEPALLAAIVNKIRGSHNVDPKRIYVAGLSAGGAMAVIMGATYPDLFSAVGVGSGLEYKAATTMSAAFTAMREGGPNPNQQGYKAYQAMGSAARPVRTIVFHGTSDYTVYPINGNQVAAQWAQTNDYVDDGSNNDSVDASADSTSSGTVSGGHSYTTYVYNDASGSPLIEKWIVDTMGHAWSGGSTSGSYTDPNGPDASREMWRFFSSGTNNGDTPPPSDPDDTTAPGLSVSPSGGTYEALVTVELSLDEKGTIYYTTDGSDPRTSSSRGSFTNNGKLTFETSTTLKAYGIDLAENASAVQTHDYAIAHPETTASFTSIGVEDGYTAANSPSDTTGGYAVGSDVYAGDNTDAPFRGVLSFDTSSLADGATILWAEVRLYYTQAPNGNPWVGLGYLLGDIKTGCLSSSCSLQPGDFEASVSQAEAITFEPPVGEGGLGTLVAGRLADSALSYINTTGKTQFKVRYQNNSNGNGYSDYALFAGGEYYSDSYRPVLVVKYK